MRGVLVEAPHGRVFGEVHDDALVYCICNYHLEKKHGPISVRPSACRSFLAALSSRAIPSSPSSSVAWRWASSQAGTAFSISRFPWARQAEGLGTGVFFRHDLQPAVRLQRLDVAAEGGRVELQNLADLGGPGQAEPGGHDQDVQLADLQAQRAQGVVVEVRDDPVQQPQAHGDARLGDRVDAAGRWLCP